MQKILVVMTTNVVPTEELERELEPFLKEGFRVAQAITTMTPYGISEKGSPERMGLNIPPGGALHMYYATTVILEK